jgi:pimeloyl-ACP methyl ester carboxylesterase
MASGDAITAAVHPEQPSDPPLRHGAVAGRRFTWVEAGPAEGPCLVMVHGLPGSHRDFRWLAPPLEAEGLRVVRLDMPGFGGSEVIGPGLSALAEGLLACLDALALTRVVLVGHSFGGPQALVAASRDPERVRGLALLASVGLRPHQGLRLLRGLPLVNRGLATPLLRRPLMDRVRTDFIRAGFSRATPDAEIRRSLRVVAGVDFSLIDRAVAALQVPTLLAACDDDRLIEAAIADELAAALPEGPRLRFATGGHNPQKTWACEIAEVLAPWATTLLATA